MFEHLESAWGKNITLGTPDTGYEATIAAGKPVTIVPACTTENLAGPLPDGTRPVSRFVRLDTQEKVDAAVKIRLYGAGTGIPGPVLRTAAVYVADDGGTWNRCSASTIDRSSRSIVA